MRETTLDTGRPGGLEISARDRLGAWLYTGAPGRMASFSIDLALTIAALGIWSTRRIWWRLRDDHSPAA